MHEVEIENIDDNVYLLKAKKRRNAKFIIALYIARTKDILYDNKFNSISFSW